MDSAAHVPDAFGVNTLVLLVRPESAPEMSEDELQALQARHLAYRSDLRERGLTVANGPVMRQSDESYRGVTIFACDLAEATRPQPMPLLATTSATFVECSTPTESFERYAKAAWRWTLTSRGRNSRFDVGDSGR